MYLLQYFNSYLKNVFHLSVNDILQFYIDHSEDEDQLFLDAVSVYKKDVYSLSYTQSQLIIKKVNSYMFNVLHTYCL